MNFIYALKTLMTLFFVMATQIAYSATVVEFYNPDLDNYFITADPGEQTFVDGGTMGHWQRTGTTFPAGGTNQVCRFYGSALGPNSHFYTADSQECSQLKSIYTPTAKSWKFESNDFSINSAVNGACAAGKTPIYRAYNNGYARGVDSNHRISPNLTDIQQVVAKGWSNEGIVMCSGSSSAEPTNKTLSAKLLGGKWTFIYTLTTTTYFNSLSFTTQATTPSSGGDYFVNGIDSYGYVVSGMYYSEYNYWSVLEPSAILDAYFIFIFTDDNHVSGCYYQAYPKGSTNLSKCYPMQGYRSSTQPQALSVNSLPRKSDTDAVLMKEVASDTTPGGFVEQGAVESYMYLRKR